MARKKNRSDDGAGIPRQELELLARVLLPTMRAYLESEEGKQDYALWLKEKNKPPKT